MHLYNHPPYYGYVNVTLSLEDDLVRRVRRIAAERDTTLTAMVRKHLEQIAAEDTAFGRKRREKEAAGAELPKSSDSPWARGIGHGRICMSAPDYLDSNVLIYAYDPNDSVKC